MKDTSDPSQLAAGTAIASNYEIVETIGQGGMSVVYKARHRLMKSYAAIKMLHAHLLFQKNIVKRFQQEAQAIKALNHANIVDVLDFGISEDGCPYLVMDYLEGTSLADLLSKGPAIDPAVCLHIFQQAAAALTHAHEKGIIHRDLKPSNIMLVSQEGDEHFVKIVDFGIAKLTDDTEERLNLTRTGEIFGSPPYMSPEQCLGGPLDPRSDIYSLGCVMYEALTGITPFKGDNALSTMHQHINYTPPPLAIPGCDPNFRESLDAIVFKALDRSPDKRYQSMRQLQAELSRLSFELDKPRFARTFILRLARLERQIGGAVKRNPLKTVVLPSLAALLLSIVLIIAMPLQSLLSRPQSSMGWLSFKLPEPQVEPTPADFVETSDRLEYLLLKMSSHLPENSQDLLERRLKTARYYMRFGYWERAAAQLKLIYAATENTEEGRSLPATEDVVVALANCYLWSHDQVKAEAFYRQALANFDRLHSADTRTGIINYNLGRIVSARGDQDAAIKIYNTAEATLGNRDAVPECAATESTLGDLYLQAAQEAASKGDLRLAADDYSRAARRFQTSFRLWQPRSSMNVAVSQIRLGECLEATGHLSEASKLYEESEKVLSLEPGNQQPRLLRIMSAHARVLFKQNRLGEALLLQWRVLTGNTRA